MEMRGRVLKSNNINLIYLVALVAPYLANDFIFILTQKLFVTSFLVDSLIRFLTLILLLCMVGFEILKELFKRPSLQSCYWIIVLTVIGLLVEKVLYEQVGVLVGFEGLFRLPAYPSLYLKILDLTFGLLLVALSEEFVFRFYLIEWLRSIYLGKCAIILISSLVFGLIHWGLGLNSIILGFLWGLLPAYYYVSRRDLLPCVIAHFVTNFFVFINN